jgi:hypothetical protein
MGLEHDFAPLLLGLLYGALLGVLVTDRPGAQPLSALQSRVIGAGIGIWLLVLLVWMLAELQVLPLNLRWFRYAFIGSVLGFAAAPWVWLHFARNFLSADQRKADDAKELLAEYMQRYTLLTIVLGIVFLAIALGPQFLRLFARAKQVDVLGVSISVAERPVATTSTAPILSFSSETGTTAIDKFTQNTSYARQIWNSGSNVTLESNPKIELQVKLETVTPDLKLFDQLSIWNKDRAFIAYFVNSDRLRRAERKSRHRSQRRETDPLQAITREDLWTYVSAAEEDSFKAEADELFLMDTAALSACLHEYAKTIGDVRLYLVDTGKFLKHLAVSLKRQKTQIDSDSSRDDTAYHRKKLKDEADEVFRQIDEVFRAIQPTNKQDQCARPPWQTDFGGLLRTPNRATPYPTLLTAFSLAAVESPETAILYIADWLEDQKAPDRLEFRRRWHILRAQIELRSLASQYIRPRIETERLIQFQRQLSDEFRDLLNVRSVGDWRKLCLDFNRGGLHSRIGRRLAFNYAVARNYLFELRTPVIVQQRYENDSAELQGLRADIEEAKALADAEDCYTGVPVFEGIDVPTARPKWLAQFKLNVVQLRIGETALEIRNLSESEIERAKEELMRLLKEASTALGPVSDNHTLKRRDERLLKSDNFDDQRARVQGLKSLVDSLQKVQ